MSTGSLDAGRGAFRAELANGIDAGARPKVYAFSHHILLPLRYELRRGRHEGNRHPLGLSCLCKFCVLRRPMRRMCLAAFACADAPSATGLSEPPCHGLTACVPFDRADGHVDPR